MVSYLGYLITQTYQPNAI